MSLSAEERALIKDLIDRGEPLPDEFRFRLFREPHEAELTWPGGKRIRLVREDGLPLGGLLHHVRFGRADGSFSAQDRQRAGLLAKRLGLTVELAG